MLYRDLIPGRLGGRYIASHITIPEGGPVADWVHFHRIAVQMIVVRRGWVRVVYEDQGEPFVMNAGDLVLQPPEIRHRVLESSPGLEVVEIGCPGAPRDLRRSRDGTAERQRSLPIATFRRSALPASRRGATRRGRLSTVARRRRPACAPRRAELPTSESSGPAERRASTFAPHDGELVFGFVLEGTAELGFGDGMSSARRTRSSSRRAKPGRCRDMSRRFPPAACHDGAARLTIAQLFKAIYSRATIRGG